jgi:protein TonB
VVALLHVGVFYALMNGLSASLTKTTTPPLQNRALDPIRPRDPPPLPPPNLNPVKWEMPKLDYDFTIPSDKPQETVRADAAPVVPARSDVDSSPPASPQHVARVSQGGPGAGFPSPDDYYPLLSKHLEEQGSATLRVCVDPSGRLTADPTLVSTSGSARLDEGALKLARAGSGHYRATTEDGRAVASCYAFRIRFQMRN